jgi:ubiquinone/menaquinone biosynthesis C-methylase UbiE
MMKMKASERRKKREQTTMNKSEKLWDRMSTVYDAGTKKFDYINIKVIENTKKYLKPNDIVLECGCGTGTLTVDVANSVKEVHAVDVSSKMLDNARAKALDRKIENINFVQSTLFDERFSIEAFDVILAFNVLHYLKDIRESIKRINTLLKPGGLFISVTPCSIEKRTFASFLFSKFISVLGQTRILPYIKFFKFAELDRIVTNENFTIVESEKLHGPEEHYFITARKR